MLGSVGAVVSGSVEAEMVSIGVVVLGSIVGSGIRISWGMDIRISWDSGIWIS